MIAYEPNINPVIPYYKIMCPELQEYNTGNLLFINFTMCILVKEYDFSRYTYLVHTWICTDLEMCVNIHFVKIFENVIQYIYTYSDMRLVFHSIDHLLGIALLHYQPMKIQNHILNLQPHLIYFHQFAQYHS